MTAKTAHAAAVNANLNANLFAALRAASSMMVVA